MYREVSVIEVREVLRAWLAGSGFRTAGAQAGVDRKTARRYVEAAVAAGLDREGGVCQLDDELIGTVLAAVRPDRPQGHGRAWEALCANHDRIITWVKDGLSVVKIGDLLARQGVLVPQRTLHRYCVERTEYRGRGQGGTVLVADGDPGSECQIDFARMGMVFDSATGRCRVTHALIFTAVYSRHVFVWLTFSQTLAAVIDGAEAAWRFFGGVFKVLIPDNMSTVVAKADSVNPQFTVGWLEYAQARGFATDPARVAHPQDKPHVERMVQAPAPPTPPVGAPWTWTWSRCPRSPPGWNKPPRTPRPRLRGPPPGWPRPASPATHASTAPPTSRHPDQTG